MGGDLLIALETAVEGRGREEWLLGGWTRNRWRPVWAKALEDAGLDDLDTYELRHTAASLAIHSGANVKTVQRMLGHASAAMTLDIYGHLWEDELDALPAAMDAHMKAERQRFADRRKRAGNQQPDSKQADCLVGAVRHFAGGQVVAGSNPVSPTVMARVKAVPEKSGTAFSILGLGPDLLERDGTTQDLLRSTMP